MGRSRCRAEAEGGAGGASRSAGRSAAWKAERRSSEWRLRWLDARTRELRHQAALCSARLSALGTTPGPPPGGAASGVEAAAAEALCVGTAAVGGAAGAGPVPMEVDAGGPPGPAPGVPAPGPSADASPAGAGAEAPAALGAAVGVEAASRGSGGDRARRPRARAAELAAPALLEHPFFAAMAGLRVGQQVPSLLEACILLCPALMCRARPGRQGGRALVCLLHAALCAAVRDLSGAGFWFCSSIRWHLRNAPVQVSAGSNMRGSTGCRYTWPLAV